MTKYYLTQFFRNIKRDKRSFLINIIGLSTALTCALFIYLWVNDEISKDKFHQNDKQLYQVMYNLPPSNRGIVTWKLTPVMMADGLETDFPEIEKAVGISNIKILGNKEGFLSNGESNITAQGLLAGSKFFDIFSFDLFLGDKDHVLEDKNSIVISEALAEKFFTSVENSIGKSLKWSHSGFEGTYTVSGIFKRPKNSSMEPFDIIFNLELLTDNDFTSREWTGCYVETYVILQEGIDVNDFNKKIKNYLATKNTVLNSTTLFIQQYSKTYLHGNYINGSPTGGRIQYVRLFSFVAIFILIIACINYVNLSTARASSRFKEIGVKKCVGANRSTLISQIISESIYMTIISLVLAYIFSCIMIPQFNILTGKNLNLFSDMKFMFIPALVSIGIGFIAGIYPALFITGLKPENILKGKLKSSFGELWIRKGLVVFQFALSTIFILGFIALNKQMEYVQNKTLGYNRDNILSFKWKGNYEFGMENSSEFDLLLSELNNVPGVQKITWGNIISDIYPQGGITWPGAESENGYSFKSPIIGYNFIETLGIEIKEGRSFSQEFNDNYSRIIINESAAKLMGYENPIGQRITMNGESEIIGVVKDFQLGSLHNKIEPMIFRFQPMGQNILVKIDSKNTFATAQQIKKIHEKLYPNYQFDFTFMDNEYQTLYESENKVAILSKYFAVFAIIISCLGMFGLSAFSIQQRKKEIGIRKVHGSKSIGIIKLLSYDFMKPVLISILFSLPLGYYIINSWLDRFAYKTDLNIWIFISTGLITIVIALITVGIQTLKTANLNPAISLKDE